MKPASVKDILDMRTGAKTKGYLVHTGCGSRIAWSLMIDGAYCQGCCTRWTYGWLIDRDHAVGRPGLYQWEPPVEVHDVFPR